MELSQLFHVLLALIVILVATKTAGALLARINQPPVIGEVLAGIMLGPSVLGHLLPNFHTFLFPREFMPVLNALAQLGVITFLFLIGLKVDPGLLKKDSKAAIFISQSGILIPFAVGMILALGLYTSFAPPGLERTPFLLFIGIAMAITAFPVLARILADKKIETSPLGQLTLACAAVDDATAWCALALVLGIMRHSWQSALVTLALTGAFVCVMLFAVRKLLAAYSRKAEPTGLTPNMVAVFLIGILASALATEGIGIHALFGAFLFGVTVPHDSRAAKELALRLESFATILLLPLFFAFTGIRTELSLLATPSLWLWTMAIIAVAILGKWGGVSIASRISGLSWRDASAIGVLMNCRGLMELIVLNVGLDHGVLTPTLFAMFVIMAIVTTTMTAPLFQCVTKGAPWTVSR